MFYHLITRDLTISQCKLGRQPLHSIMPIISKKRVQPSTNHKLKGLYELNNSFNYSSGCQTIFTTSKCLFFNSRHNGNAARKPVSTT